VATSTSILRPARARLLDGFFRAVELLALRGIDFSFRFAVIAFMGPRILFARCARQAAQR
jgi:hypothetical protein